MVEITVVNCLNCPLTEQVHGCSQLAHIFYQNMQWSGVLNRSSAPSESRGQHTTEYTPTEDPTDDVVKFPASWKDDDSDGAVFFCQFIRGAARIVYLSGCLISFCCGFGFQVKAKYVYLIATLVGEFCGFSARIFQLTV